MRVLMVSHTAQPAGSNRVILSLLRHAPSDAQISSVFLSGGPVVNELLEIGQTAYVLDSGRVRHAVRAVKAVRRLQRLAVNFDLVVSHVSKAQLLGGVAALIANKPSVWFQHEVPGTPVALQRLAAMTRPDLTIANSDYVASQHRVKWPQAKVARIYPGVETVKEEECHEHVRTTDSQIFVLSRLDRWKRVDRAIRAFAMAGSEHPNIRLVVLGGETSDRRNAGYFDELKSLCRSLRVEERVEFRGHVANGASALRSADMLLQLSDQEPFGLSVAEALTRKVPAIVSNNGGATEIVSHGKSGFVEDSNDTSAIASRISELSNDPSMRREFGALGRQFVVSRFDEKKQSLTMWHAMRRIASSDEIR